MSNVYVFDPALFKEMYPQFAGYSDALLTLYFNKAAATLLDNSENACVPLEERQFYFFLLVAHMASLQDRVKNGQGAMVGRVSSATEGSVSISTDYNVTGNSAQWYNQTPYGAEYWALTAKYRTALYVIEHAAMPVHRFGGRW